MGNYSAIYLSPHLDDVALSCGGQIFDRTAAGEQVLIVTVAAGDPPAGTLSPFAQALHARWQLTAAAVRERRVEDVAACNLLGADHAHWPIPDCIYRTHPDTGKYLYASETAIFGEIHPVETRLINKLAQRLATLPAAAKIFAPLAIGHHVDHQLVRAAALRRAGSELLFYEDYPYVRWEDAAERALTPPHTDWRATVVPVSAAGVAARIEAVAAFASQVGTFFDDRADLEQQLYSHVQQTGGERQWQHLSSL